MKSLLKAPFRNKLREQKNYIKKVGINFLNFFLIQGVREFVLFLKTQ